MSYVSRRSRRHRTMPRAIRRTRPPPDDAEDEFAESLEAWCDAGGFGETRTTFVMFAGCALFEFLAEECDRPLSTLDRADVDEFLLDHMPRGHDWPDEPER